MPAPPETTTMNEQPEFDPSSRESVARKLADLVCENDLGVPYGGYSGKEPDSNHRVRHVTSFSRPSKLDGMIEVYGIEFIRVWWDFAGTPYGIWKGSRIFSFWEDAWEFINLAFVHFDDASAKCIPIKKGTKADD